MNMPKKRSRTGFKKEEKKPEEEQSKKKKNKPSGNSRSDTLPLGSQTSVEGKRMNTVPLKTGDYEVIGTTEKESVDSVNMDNGDIDTNKDTNKGSDSGESKKLRKLRKTITKRTKEILDKLKNIIDKQEQEKKDTVDSFKRKELFLLATQKGYEIIARIFGVKTIVDFGLLMTGRGYISDYIWEFIENKKFKEETADFVVDMVQEIKNNEEFNDRLLSKRVEELQSKSEYRRKTIELRNKIQMSNKISQTEKEKLLKVLETKIASVLNEEEKMNEELKIELEKILGLYIQKKYSGLRIAKDAFNTAFVFGGFTGILRPGVSIVLRMLESFLHERKQLTKQELEKQVETVNSQNLESLKKVKTSLFKTGLSMGVSFAKKLLAREGKNKKEQVINLASAWAGVATVAGMSISEYFGLSDQSFVDRLLDKRYDFSREGFIRRFADRFDNILRFFGLVNSENVSNLDTASISQLDTPVNQDGITDFNSETTIDSDSIIDENNIAEIHKVIETKDDTSVIDLFKVKHGDSFLKAGHSFIKEHLKEFQAVYGEDFDKHKWLKQELLRNGYRLGKGYIDHPIVLHEGAELALIKDETGQLHMVVKTDHDVSKLSHYLRETKQTETMDNDNDREYGLTNKDNELAKQEIDEAVESREQSVLKSIKHKDDLSVDRNELQELAIRSFNRTHSVVKDVDSLKTPDYLSGQDLELFSSLKQNVLKESHDLISQASSLITGGGIDETTSLDLLTRSSQVDVNREILQSLVQAETKEEKAEALKYLHAVTEKPQEDVEFTSKTPVETETTTKHVFTKTADVVENNVLLGLETIKDDVKDNLLANLEKYTDQKLFQKIVDTFSQYIKDKPEITTYYKDLKAGKLNLQDFIDGLPAELKSLVIDLEKSQSALIDLDHDGKAEIVRVAFGDSNESALVEAPAGYYFSVGDNDHKLYLLDGKGKTILAKFKSFINSSGQKLFKVILDENK